MSILILPTLAVIIPTAGALLSLFLSQLEEPVAAEGKTRDWIMFLFVSLPTAIISFIMTQYMHFHATFSITWLPGLDVGIRLNELATIFACTISSLGALVALYSIRYMEFDRYRTSYWFFFQLTIAAMLLGVFSNNLLWMFGAFEVASLGAFFLISHWHRKSGEEGEKCGKAAMRFIIISAIADVFLLIGFGMLFWAFGSMNLEEIFVAWVKEPVNVLLGSSKNTRLLIEIFVVLGALVKSAQIALLFWPLSGKQADYDLAKSPLTVSAFLMTATIANIGLYILECFYPIFSLSAVEAGTGIELFSNVPFILIGWSAIVMIIIATAMMISSDNINRVVVGAAVAQISFSFLGLSAANKLGYVSANFHLVTSTVTNFALFVIFGMVIESLRIKTISRINGLKEVSPLLHYMGVLSILGYVGVLPLSNFFSRDMILEALRRSVVPSSLVLLILAIIGSLILAFAIVKVFMQIFYGKMEENLAIRPLNWLSIVSGTIVLEWVVLSGITLILYGQPTPFFVWGLLDKSFDVNYANPLFSNFLISFLTLGLVLGVVVATFFLYRDGEGKLLERIREMKVTKALQKFFVNGLYLDKLYNLIIIKPLTFIGRFFAWMRIRAPFASVVWVLLSTVLLLIIMLLLGGI